MEQREEITKIVANGIKLAAGFLGEDLISRHVARRHTASEFTVCSFPARLSFIFTTYISERRKTRVC